MIDVHAPPVGKRQREWSKWFPLQRFTNRSYVHRWNPSLDHREQRRAPSANELGPKVAGTGFELPHETTGNSSGPAQSGAECGALDAQNGPFDLDLTAVVDAWPTLPATTRRSILAMVERPTTDEHAAGDR